MPNTENIEDNTEPNTHANTSATTTTTTTTTTHVINVEQHRQSPEMAQPNPPRHSSPSISLALFDANAHRTLRNSTSLVENISSRVEGLRPLLERYPRLSSLFSIQRHRRDAPTTSEIGENYIINIEENAAASSGANRGSLDERHRQLHNQTSRGSVTENRVLPTISDPSASGSRNEANNDANNEETNQTDDATNTTTPAATSAGTTAADGASDAVPIDADGNNNNNNNNSEESSIAENMSTSEELPLSPEVRALLLMIKSYLPYVSILLVKIAYDHIEGILNLLLCLLTFIRVNSELKQEIAKQQNRSWLTLLRILCQIAGCFFVVGVIFGEEIFIAFYSEPVTMLELLWSVAIMDFALKLITVTIKVFLTCLPTGLLAIPQRGKYYVLVEATSQVYRCTAPIKPWLCYLFKAYQGPEMIFSILLSFAYAISKTSDIFSRISFFWTAVSKLLQNMSLGVAPSKEQLVEAGGVCAICHEEYSTPVRLSCKHIFCEACVSTWLDRERSCPLCRAAITDDPIYRDGHTTNYMQLY